MPLLQLQQDPKSKQIVSTDDGSGPATSAIVLAAARPATIVSSS